MGKIISSPRPQQPIAETSPVAAEPSSAGRWFGILLVLALIAGAVVLANAAWHVAPA